MKQQTTTTKPDLKSFVHGPFLRHVKIKNRKAYFSSSFAWLIENYYFEN